MVTLILDFDGTIVEGFSWEETRKFYGVPSEMIDKYMKGEVTIEDWSDWDFLRIMKKFREADVKKIMAKLPLRRGFDEFAKKYFSRFEEVAILSGGFPQIVRSFAGKYGIKTHGVEYEEKGGETVITRHIDGESKQEIFSELYSEKRVLYVVDEAPGFENYELRSYGKNVLKIQMGSNGEGELVVHDFFELGELADRILANPGKCFK